MEVVSPISVPPNTLQPPYIFLYNAMQSNGQVKATDYDFVIVGGGTAGLTLATRLSEDPNTTVVVLEAGEEHLADPRINTPALWPALLGSDVDWNFVTEPQVSEFHC